MIGMQYKIGLPSDYDMDIIRNRVKNNGNKTDGFESLKYKFYLITEKSVNGNIQNSYAPLYLWKDHLGMNKFLFEGPYDNILDSFGWQNVNIGIPLLTEFSGNIKDSKYVLEFSGSISPSESLMAVKENIMSGLPKIIGSLGSLVIYNPDKWKYNTVIFLEDIDTGTFNASVVYDILHISGESK